MNRKISVDHSVDHCTYNQLVSVGAVLDRDLLTLPVIDSLALLLRPVLHLLPGHLLALLPGHRHAVLTGHLPLHGVLHSGALLLGHVVGHGPVLSVAVLLVLGVALLAGHALAVLAKYKII